METTIFRGELLVLGSVLFTPVFFRPQGVVAAAAHQITKCLVGVGFWDACFCVTPIPIPFSPPTPPQNDLKKSKVQESKSKLPPAKGW